MGIPLTPGPRSARGASKTSAERKLVTVMLCDVDESVEDFAERDPLPPRLELGSLAGHDAMTLTRAGVDCGMLFVRSRRGVSHSPAEYSSPEDCALAASVLGRAALELAAAGRG